MRELVVLQDTGERATNGDIKWLCKCCCGADTVVNTSNLKTTKSCGCLRKERGKEWGSKSGEDAERYKHGHGNMKNPTYISWCAMKQRCTNTKHKFYSNYGGRGIKVCDRWLTSFENFLHDMGERPNNTTIDRINRNGMYDRNNCRWVDRVTQNRNRKGVRNAR